MAGVVLEADAGSKFKPGACAGSKCVHACVLAYSPPCTNLGTPVEPVPAPGDRVMGLTYRCVGAYSSHVVLPEAALARCPDCLTFEQAASLPLVALTGWQALELAALQPGQRVLVHAGAGGVGTAAVQLAKARGLHVVATCSAKNMQFVREVGQQACVWRPAAVPVCLRSAGHRRCRAGVAQPTPPLMRCALPPVCLPAPAGCGRGY